MQVTRLSDNVAAVHHSCQNCILHCVITVYAAGFTGSIRKLVNMLLGVVWADIGESHGSLLLFLVTHVMLRSLLTSLLCFAPLTAYLRTTWR